jgi:hypothetical protein
MRPLTRGDTMTRRMGPRVGSLLTGALLTVAMVVFADESQVVQMPDVQPPKQFLSAGKWESTHDTAGERDWQVELKPGNDNELVGRIRVVGSSVIQEARIEAQVSGVSSVYGFHQSFSVCGVRVGGVEAGVTGGVGGFVASLASDFGFSFSLGGVGLTPGEAGFVVALLASVSAAPATLATFTPTSVGQLFAFPLTLLASVVFLAFSLFNSPLAVRIGNSTGAFFGGNPGGFVTLGYAIWGPGSTYGDLKAFGYVTSVVDALYLAHEAAHFVQFGTLGAAFLPAYLAQFPAAVPAVLSTGNLNH